MAGFLFEIFASPRLLNCVERNVLESFVGVELEIESEMESEIESEITVLLDIAGCDRKQIVK